MCEGSINNGKGEEATLLEGREHFRRFRAESLIPRTDVMQMVKLRQRNGTLTRFGWEEVWSMKLVSSRKEQGAESMGRRCSSGRAGGVDLEQGLLHRTKGQAYPGPMRVPLATPLICTILFISLVRDRNRQCRIGAL